MLVDGFFVDYVVDRQGDMDRTKINLVLCLTGLVVADAAVAFETSVKHGAVPVLPPTSLPAGSPNPTQTISEVRRCWWCWRS